MENQNGISTGLVMTSDAQKDVKELAGNIGKMKTGISIAPRYWEFESEGESVRCLFMGFTQFDTTKDDGTVVELTAVVWMGEDERLYLNAGTSLVSAFNTANIPQKTPVEIVYEGKKKVSKGHMKLYDVRLLIPNK